MLKQFFTPTFISFEPKKSTSEIIEEIHDTFYTEVDKLLAEANISNSLDTDKQGLIDKCARLKELGFTNTKEVKEAEGEISRLETLKKENEEKKGLIEAINYFSFRYPHYKFITENSVKRICEKYGLVYGEISKYTGTVPDENLKHIEDFKIAEDDECYEKKGHVRGLRGIFNTEFVSKSHLEAQIEKEKNDAMAVSFYGDVQYSINKCPLEIAAPLGNFDMKGQEVKDFKVSKIEIPDPIVLKPVIFNGQKHYLIVTAWGLEAEDTEVMNQNHN